MLSLSRGRRHLGTGSDPKYLSLIVGSSNGMAGPARPRLWYALPRLIRFRVRSVCFRDEDTNGDSDGFAKYRRLL